MVHISIAELYYLYRDAMQRVRIYNSVLNHGSYIIFHY
jgi:hypothetical protein